MQNYLKKKFESFVGYKENEGTKEKEKYDDLFSMINHQPYHHRTLIIFFFVKMFNLMLVTYMYIGKSHMRVFQSGNDDSRAFVLSLLFLYKQAFINCMKMSIFQDSNHYQMLCKFISFTHVFVYFLLFLNFQFLATFCFSSYVSVVQSQTVIVQFN